MVGKTKQSVRVSCGSSITIETDDLEIVIKAEHAGAGSSTVFLPPPIRRHYATALRSIAVTTPHTTIEKALDNNDHATQLIYLLEADDG